MAQKPREHLRWDLLDRSGDPVPWDPEDSRSLRDFYKRLATAAGNAAGDIRRLEADDFGEGKTAETLQEFVQELPKYLDKAQDAYEGGYHALRDWHQALQDARDRSEDVVRGAEEAFRGLEEQKEWEEGDDPLRTEYVDLLEPILTGMNEAAEECGNALDEAKQGNPRELWGWLDAIVTWVEDNPILTAVLAVVAGLAAIFIPGLGVALALALMAVSSARLFREGKLGFNLETIVTLGVDALSMVPGGAFLRGGQAVARVARPVTGPMGRGIRSAASSTRAGRGIQTVSTRVASGVRTASTSLTRTRANHISADIAYSVSRDTAVGMGSSVAVQVAQGKDPSDIHLGHEFLGALGTNALGATAGVARDHGHMPSFFGGEGGGNYTSGTDLDGTPTTTYTHEGGEGQSDFTMTVRPDDVSVGDMSVSPGDDGLQVSRPDDSSVTTTREGGGTVDLTGPEGTPGASYRDNEISVPTNGDGSVSVTRAPEGPTIHTDDGLSLHQPDQGGEPVQITQTGGDRVDLDFGDSGPTVSRPESVEGGGLPRTEVADSDGRTAEVGSDGYRVDTQSGSTQGYDRGADAASIDAGGTRIDTEPGTVRVVDESGGVDIQQWDNGTGIGSGAGSQAMVREDGSALIRTDNPSLSPRATQDPDGHVRIDGDGPRGSDAWPGQVRTESGTSVVVLDRGGETSVQVWHADGTRRSYGPDGEPHGAYPPLSRNPDTGEPYVISEGTRVSVVPRTEAQVPGAPNPGPSLRMETSQGWTVTTSRDGGMSTRAPENGGGDALRITRHPDGSTEMGTDTHGVGLGPEGVTARGPGDLSAGSGRDGSHVTDGTTRTEVTYGESSGLGTARTTAVGEDRTVAGHDGAEGSVTTRDGFTVRTRGEEVRTDVPADGVHRAARNGDRVLDTGPDGIGVRGPSPDGPGHVPPRTGETAGEGGRVPPGWQVSADAQGGIRGQTHPDHRIEARPPGESGRLPHRPSDDVSFRNGDVEGSQSSTGRTTLTDGETTVREGRGGVRVDSGAHNPDLHIDQNGVRVSNPDGSAQRVDYPQQGGDQGRLPNTNRPEPGSVRAAGQEVVWQVAKNVLNLAGGFGLDNLRLGLDWWGDEVSIDKSYWIQNAMQVASAVPKAGYEELAGMPSGGFRGDLAGIPMEMGHQAMRNDLKDEYIEHHDPELHQQNLASQAQEAGMDEEVPRVGQAAEADLRDHIAVLDALLEPGMREDYLAEHGASEENVRLVDQVIEEAARQREMAGRRLEELKG